MLDSIKLLRHKVLLRPLHPSREDFFLPETERYPKIGEVIAFGKLNEDIRVGDLAILPDEGTFQGRTYYQVCFIVFRDYPERVLCPAECEPVLRDAVEKHRRNSEYDPTILVEPLEGDKITFNPSDVLEFGLEDLSNPTIKLEYTPVRLLHLWNGGKLETLYEIDESEILFLLRKESD